jgi:hypothetical protein
MLWAIMKLDASVFVFSDYSPGHPRIDPLSRCKRIGRERFWNEVFRDFRRNHVPFDFVESTEECIIFRCGDKWGFLFFQDNNEVLARVSKSGWKIDMFVGICDGCLEGGNYECVNRGAFFSKLLTAGSNSLTYITDHCEILEAQVDASFAPWARFRRQVTYPDYWHFSLQRCLVRSGCDDDVILLISVLPHCSQPSESESQLCHLAPFVERCGSAIAEYGVRASEGRPVHPPQMTLPFHDLV